LVKNISAKFAFNQPVDTPQEYAYWADLRKTEIKQLALTPETVARVFDSTAGGIYSLQTMTIFLINVTSGIGKAEFESLL